MKCLNCPAGELESGTTTKTFQRDLTLVVLREIPAQVCHACGAAIFSGAVTERLLEIVDEAVRQRTQILVREFAFSEETDAAQESARSRVGAAGR